MIALAYLALIAAKHDPPEIAKYVSVVDYKVIGWRSAGRYFVFESDEGGQGPSIVNRDAVDASTGTVAKHWSCDADSGALSVDAQSKRWMASNPASGAGKTVFQYKGPYFTDDKQIAASPAHAGFRRGSDTYTLNLAQSLGKQESTPGKELKFKRAKFTLSIRKGAGPWHVLHRDTDFSREALAYCIDRVVLSPSGRNAAVVLRQYHYVWFEGWNVSAVGLPIAGKLP